MSTSSTQAMPGQVDDRLTQLATRVTNDIATARSDGKTGHPIPVKDMDTQRFSEIEGLLCSVVTAAYPFVESCGNAHTTKSSALGLKKSLDQFDMSEITWNRGEGVNDSIINLWMTWRLKSAKFRALEEDFMDGRLTLPPLTNRYQVRKGEQTHFGRGSGYVEWKPEFAPVTPGATVWGPPVSSTTQPSEEDAKAIEPSASE